MSLSPPSPSRSRKRLSDSGAGKPQWLQQLPRLSAEHQRLFQTVQKLQLKVGFSINVSTFAARNGFNSTSGLALALCAQLA
jgi:hypothetical protein